MKVNQIVSEHKKGHRAKKYTKKPGSAIGTKKAEPIKPQGPLKVGQVNEATLSTGKVVANDGKTITVAMPDGTQIQKPITAVSNDPQGNPVFNLVSTPAPGQAPGTPTPQTPQQKYPTGSNMPVNTGAPVEEEHDDIGGDKTDDYIDDVTDHEFEKGAEMQESPEVPYQVKAGPQPMAMTSPKPTAIVASKLWTAITPEIEAKASAQGFRKVMLQFNGQQVPGLEGGDQQLGSKIIVAPTDFQSMSVAGAGTMRRPMGVQSAERTGIGAPPMKESDTVLLNKMLTIAGLR